MLTIQVPDDKHTGVLSRFIEQHRIPVPASILPEETMVLIEDGNILGYGAYQRQNDEAVVAVLYIDPAVRGMGYGDGVLRALLNLMDRSGIRRFFIAAEITARGFLAAEDLAPCTEVPGWVEAPSSECFWFEGTLPEFFQKPCKGGRLKP